MHLLLLTILIVIERASLGGLLAGFNMLFKCVLPGVNSAAGAAHEGRLKCVFGGHVHVYVGSDDVLAAVGTHVRPIVAAVVVGRAV